MNAASIKRLGKVHPVLAEKIQDLSSVLFTRDIDIEVVQGLRTFAEQDALFAQGRTKPGKRVTNAKGGQSNHNYGVAVDVAPAKDGKIDWDDEDAFDAIGAAGKKLGLEWGGDWRTFVDRPHLQLPSPSIAALRKLYDKGGLPTVWAGVKPGRLPVPPREEVATSDITDKGVTTSPDKKESEIEGTPPPAEAVEIKASQPSILSRLGSLSIPAGVMGILGGVATFLQSVPIWVWVALGSVAILAGVYLWNEAQKRAQERTLKIMTAAASREQNNLRLV